MNKNQPSPYFTVREYIQSDCMQFEQPLIASALHAVTGGRMCNGCPAYNHGKCKSFLQMLATRLLANPPPKAVPTETVRQEAERTGVSLNEVRRRRNSGLT